MKTMGKLTVIPGIFGINEPMVFGLPLVLNPIIMIPFFVAPLVNVSIAYGFMHFGLASYTTGVMVPWTTPNLLSGVLATNDIMGGVIQLISLVTTALIYYPFMRMLDNKYLRDAKENRTLNMEEVRIESKLKEVR